MFVLCKASLQWILFLQDTPRDSSLLAGTALALLLNLTEDTKLTSSTVITLFNSIVSSDKPLQIGVLNIQPLRSHTVGAVDSQVSFGHMALLNGVVCCSSATLFAQPIQEDEQFAAWLFDKICELCHVTQFQYHSFRLLLQWFGKAQQSLGCIIAKNSFFTSQTESNVRTKSMQLVWTHLDSPVDGVNEIVIDVFKVLLKILRQEEGLLSQSQEEKFTVEKFIEETKSLSLQMSWNIKGKHYILASIITEVDVVKVSGWW